MHSGVEGEETMTIAEQIALPKRIDRLEAENRALKRFFMIGLLVAGCVVAMGQVNPKRAVEAERIVVRDSQGRARITLGTPVSSGVAIDMKSDDPAIWISDEHGTDRMILTIEGVRLADANGRPTKTR
jgi:hypothetical protein